MITDHIYLNALAQIEYMGDRLRGRNGDTVSYYAVDNMLFTQTPLVTLRKTAWKMALREMEWFMSGDPKCPEALLPWWEKQLDVDGHYYGGYGQQLREFDIGFMDATTGGSATFDQIKSVFDSLRTHPHSRRLCFTAWHPWEMANITALNTNPNTPTTCHSAFVQLFVRDGRLHMSSYQRSADMLLGVPHNLIQSWALLLWFAHWSGWVAGSLRWIIGDAHIYCEESHRETLKALLNQLPGIGLRHEQAKNPFELVYRPPADIAVVGGCPEFKADHFQMIGEIPYPSVALRPKLL